MNFGEISGLLLVTKITKKICTGYKIFDMIYQSIKPFENKTNDNFTTITKLKTK